MANVCTPTSAPPTPSGPAPVAPICLAICCLGGTESSVCTAAYPGGTTCPVCVSPSAVSPPAVCAALFERRRLSVCTPATVDSRPGRSTVDVCLVRLGLGVRRHHGIWPTLDIKKFDRKRVFADTENAI